MARIATPEMLRFRYDPGLASGVIASAGTLGSLIPPSILMILYGYFAEVSIAKLFMAGFIPGLLSALMFSAMIVVRASITPALAPPVTERFTREEKIAALREVWPMPVLIVGVLSGIFVGLFTPTEAGAVGAFLAILLALVRRSFSWTALREAVLNTIVGTAGIFMVVVGTVLLAKLMALSRLPTFLTEQLLVLGGDRYAVILIVVVLYLILGMFLDSIGILLLTLPILLPIAHATDIDLIWFGIILIKLLEIGLVTPASRAQRLRAEGRAREPRAAADDLSRRRLVHRHRYDDARDHRLGAGALALAAGPHGLGARSPPPINRRRTCPRRSCRRSPA